MRHFRYGKKYLRKRKPKRFCHIAKTSTLDEIWERQACGDADPEGIIGDLLSANIMHELRRMHLLIVKSEICVSKQTERRLNLLRCSGLGEDNARVAECINKLEKMRNIKARSRLETSKHYTHMKHEKITPEFLQNALSVKDEDWKLAEVRMEFFPNGLGPNHADKLAEIFQTKYEER